MNQEQARFNMVEQQIRTWKVLDPQVLDLLFIVKREGFVPAALRKLAFADVDIPLGHGASMFPPKIEAHALQALQLKPHATVLEIGAGSGYMAALLAAHADHVWTVEIVPELAEMARANLARHGVTNVSVDTGDGLAADGAWRAHGPFDAIMVSGALPMVMVPPELLAALKPGGRLFAIVGEAPLMTAQVVTRVGEGGFRTENLFETQAMPMVNAPTPSRFTF